MMDSHEFAEHLQSALAHLHDSAYLESHPLVPLLLPGQGHPAAPALRNLLFQAIERLKPEGDLPHHSAPWRRYYYLLNRYVRLKSVVQVAREMGVSERQSLRVQGEAVEDLASALWPRGAASPVGPDRVDPSLPEVTAIPLVVEELVVEEGEAARLVARSPTRNVRLAEVLDGVMATIARLASARKVNISADVPLDLPPIAVERTLLRQGLLSLLTASLNVGVQVVVLSGRPLSAAVELRLLVVGGGEPAAAGKRQTRPVRRSDGRGGALARVSAPPADARAAEGTRDGLARSLAQRLQEEHSLRVAAHLLALQGGEVDVSEADRGQAVVHVNLPFVQPVTVLIVDDNPDTLELFARYLGGGAYRVIEASSGGRALHLARQVHPAAIVMDVMMPDQDGWETLQGLRNHPDTEHIPVIICSVLNERDLALSLGANDLLPKPVTPQALLHALERCLEDSTERSS